MIVIYYIFIRSKTYLSYIDVMYIKIHKHKMGVYLLFYLEKQRISAPNHRPVQNIILNRTG